MKWFKRKKRPLPEDTTCRNCGTQTLGKYCHECGQDVFAGRKQRILQLIIQAVDNLFSFEGKTPRTLLLLMFRPGFLSNEFREGRINRYVHPVKLFWMSTLILFALMIFQLDKTDKQEIIKINDTPTPTQKGLNFSFNSSASSSDTIPIPVIKEDEDKDEDKDYDKLNNKTDQILKHFTRYAPYASFLLVPIFALLLVLFFCRKKEYFIYHLTFTVHFHTFLWIFCSVLLFVNIFTHGWKYPDWLTGVLFFTPGVYFTMALRRYYKTKSWWQAVWKAILISLLYFILILTVIVAAMLLIYLGKDF